MASEVAFGYRKGGYFMVKGNSSMLNADWKRKTNRESFKTGKRKFDQKANIQLLVGIYDSIIFS